MKLSVNGAEQGVTGSCQLLENQSERIKTGKVH